jgi:hypothetical protein
MPSVPVSIFYCVTGASEPDCILVLLTTGKTHDHLLFIELNPGKTDATFFTGLVDAGIECDSLFTADITVAFPICKRHSGYPP